MKKSRISGFFILFIFVLSLFLFTACNKSVNETVFAFGTAVNFNLKGKSVDDTVSGLTALYNGLDGEFDPEARGDVFRINDADAFEEIKVSDDTYFMLRLAKKAYDETDGVFNVATYPLSEVWKFTSKTYSAAEKAYDVPSAEQIEVALSHSDLDKLELLSDNTVRKTDRNLKISFGALAKGYAGDVAFSEGLIKEGQSGILNVGGTIFTVGDGNYKIGISNPRDSDSDYFGRFELSGNAVICTSGDYERYYIGPDGKRYCHILGKDGRPVDNGIISVTVLSLDRTTLSGAECDYLSTSVFALGKEGGKSLAAKYNAGLVIIYSDKTFELFNINPDIFTLKDTEYTLKNV